MSHKIILSRKGFDSTAGGIPSPAIRNIFYSLPIPEGGSDLFYEDLRFREFDMSLLTIIRMLGAKQYSECHMDPNLSPRNYGLSIADGWSPVFGQDDIALTHLLNKNVSIGDVFLFFGKFRMAESLNSKNIQYITKRKFHAIYGFLEIGEIVKVTQLTPKQKLLYKNHPHVKHPEFYESNSTLFIPAEKSIHGFEQTVGTFQYSKELVITDGIGKLLTDWIMPKPFWSKKFSYKLHINNKGKAKSPGRGQEMVGEATTDILKWVKKQIEAHSVDKAKNERKK